MLNIGGLSALASTPVDVYDEGLYLYETFEEDTFAADKAAGKLNIGESKNTVSFETPGANGTKGAAHVQYKVDTSYITYDAKLIPGQKYRASAWIKLNDISLVKNEMHFLYFCNVTGHTSQGYEKFYVRDAGLKENEWVLVSTEFVVPEKLGVPGTGGQSFTIDPEAVGTIGVRMGDNGQFSNIDGYAEDNTLFYDFSIDDFIVEPLPADVTVDDSVALTYLGSDCNISKSNDVPVGITGQSNCITSKSFGYVNMKYKAPDMWMNKAYKIGYWAKAELAEGGTYGNVSVVVYNTTANSSKDNRIPKWPTYNLGTLTGEWKYYEYVYYVGLNTFDERLDADGNVEFRISCGSTAGSKIYMVGMNIQSLDMPYQAQVNRGISIDKTAEITTPGWCYPVYSSVEEDTSVYSTGYRMVGTNHSVSQYVQIKDNRKYKISFKAKAESYVNGGETIAVTKDNTLPIFILLDRSGNKPTPGSGTSTEDWTDNYTSETTPSYKYQYISGASHGKDANWGAGLANSNKNWNLTNEWQEFSAIYTWDYLGNDYRMPLMSFRVGNDATNPLTATWSIADVKIEEITSPAEVKNFRINGELTEFSKISISYDYVSSDNREEGISYVRVLTGSEASGWTTLDVIEASVFKDGYTIPRKWGGKKLKIELLPISTDGACGVIYSKEIDVKQITYSGSVVAYEMFDGFFDKGNVGGANTLSWKYGGADGSFGCLHVKQTRDQEDLTNLPGKMVKGNTYKISAWIKLDGITLTNQKVNFIYWSKTEGGSNGYIMLPAEARGINNGGWQYVEMIHTYEGILGVVGAGADYDAASSSSFSVRLGDGKISQAGENATAITYYIDNYTLELVEDAQGSVVYEEDELIDMEFRQHILTDDVVSVDGNVFCENLNEDLDATSFIAFYDANNNLVGYQPANKSVSASGSDSWSVSMQNQKDAAYAKLFLWEDSTLKPISNSEELVKLPKGTYIYVDSSSKAGTQDGSFEAPYKTIEAAKDKVRTMLETAQDDIYVLFKEGEYFLDGPVEFTTEDCKDGVNVIYSAFNDDKVVFTGGQQIKGFELYDKTNNIYVANVPKGTASRQLFVNGVRATRARSVAGLQDGEYLGTEGLSTTDMSFLDYENITDLEMVFYSRWTNPRCQVSSVKEDNGKVIFTMDEPAWSDVTNKGYSSVTTPDYYENALELLDEEGEWYLDSTYGLLYYKPRFFENLNDAEVVLPVTEKLFEITGETADEPIKNIKFRNIEFSYTTWNRPSSKYGHSDAQNNHLRDSQNKIDDVLIDGVVEVHNAVNVDFERCTFSRLGSTALKMTGAIQDCDITENEFYELSASAINLGEPSTSNVRIYNPTDEKYFITDNIIADNYIHKIGVDYRSAAGISAGFPKNTQIRNNEITDVPYSGMHIGYGWDSLKTTGLENVHISDNYIHNVLNDKVFDGGAIYTNGATGGNTNNYNMISRNYIENVGHGSAALYTDEGSTYWKMSENVVDLTENLWWYDGTDKGALPRWLSVWRPSIDNNVYSGNYTTVSNYVYQGGPNNVLENTTLCPTAYWPDEAIEIVKKAGITASVDKNITYKLQDIITENTLSLDAGEIHSLSIEGVTSKNRSYDLSNVDIYTKSSNENVVSVNGLNITAKSSGNCVITVVVVENGICWTEYIDVSVG